VSELVLRSFVAGNYTGFTDGQITLTMHKRRRRRGEVKWIKIMLF
jgi:hypothetical protein